MNDATVVNTVVNNGIKNFPSVFFRVILKLYYQRPLTGGGGGVGRVIGGGG